MVDNGGNMPVLRGSWPVRRRQIRDHRAAAAPAQLPLHVVLQAAGRGVPQQGAGAAQRLQVGARRGPADVLRGHSRLPPRLQSVCGSPIVNWAEPHSPFVRRNPQILTEYGIALATLDDDPGVRPACHIFVRSKAPWFDIIDEPPHYPEYPPPA